MKNSCCRQKKNAGKPENKKRRPKKERKVTARKKAKRNKIVTYIHSRTEEKGNLSGTENITAEDLEATSDRVDDMADSASDKR